jgi:hypothetical protein
VLVAAMLVWGAAAAPARAALTVAERSIERGWVGLAITDGASYDLVSVREDGRLRARVRLGADGRGDAERVAPWRCDRRLRTFTVTDSEGERAEVVTETPSCTGRLALHATPAQPRAGAPLRVRIVDRWRSGHLRACLAVIAPAGARRCEHVRIEARGAVARLRAPRAGRWTVRLRGDGITASKRLKVLPRNGPLTVLATGDSLMAPVARMLAPMLASRGTTMIRDVHYGAAISNSFVLDWRKHARRSARRWRPDVVLLFIGGHEGWPFGTVGCCGEPWAGRYAERARAVARTYRHGAATQFYVLSLPAPADSTRATIFTAVNAGLGRAFAITAPDARLLDMSAIFTPGFVFRRTMPVDGHSTVVRMADGLHLTHPGGTVAARAIVAALAQDAILP